MPTFKFFRIALFLTALALMPLAACFADTIDLGVVQFVLGPDTTTAGFNISNHTGPNASAPGDTSFPVVTSVPFADLTLLVNFSDGSFEEFDPGSGYFSLAGDNLSFTGLQETDFVSKTVQSAFLIGTFGVTDVSLNDGSATTISPDFTALISDPSDVLQNGEFALIEASTVVVAETPEPTMTGLLAACGFGILFLPRRALR